MKIASPSEWLMLKKILPYKNLIIFFIKAIRKLDKKRLKEVTRILVDATKDGVISPNEWNRLGGQNGLGVVKGNGK
jgi:hypothetical protein|tara:strand:- start:441 stop:668 length:228 start_codon:yes stop_codon:yes gene_type:complete